MTMLGSSELTICLLMCCGRTASLSYFGAAVGHISSVPTFSSKIVAL
jgi:hypothetical protein